MKPRRRGAESGKKNVPDGSDGGLGKDERKRASQEVDCFDQARESDDRGGRHRLTVGLARKRNCDRRELQEGIQNLSTGDGYGGWIVNQNYCCRSDESDQRTKNGGDLEFQLLRMEPALRGVGWV